MSVAGKKLGFRILGPLEVVEDDRPLPLRGKLLRSLLAALLIHPREIRTADQLIDDLWTDRAPVGARPSLHNLVSSLRRTLGGDVLETTHCGYVLAVEEDAVDASRFERLLARVRDARVDEKVRLLEQANGLWRGSPLVDFRYEEFAQCEIRRLEELHVCGLEELLGAKLELGAGSAVVPELQRLVDGFPYREQLRMHLMVALHRSGRTVEALSNYVDWRRTLMDAWGIEPGRAIQQLWNDIRVHARYLEIAV
jgi:DNA-binding SARP family transcriptional activator